MEAGQRLTWAVMPWSLVSLAWLLAAQHSQQQQQQAGRARDSKLEYSGGSVSSRLSSSAEDQQVRLCSSLLLYSCCRRVG